MVMCVLSNMSTCGGLVGVDYLTDDCIKVLHEWMEEVKFISEKATEFLDLLFLYISYFRVRTSSYLHFLLF